MYNFGAGRAYLYPAGGGTALELGTVQNATVELKVELKSLYGAWRFPVAVADGKGTASGKVTFAHIWPETIAAITGGTQSKLYAATPPPSNAGPWPDNVGGVTPATAESGTIAPSTPFTYPLVNGSSFIPGTEVVSVIIPNYGPVYYSRVASAPTAATIADPTNGTYTISPVGLMTFGTGDQNRTVKVSYLYSPVAATNQIAVQLAQVGMNTALTFCMLLIGTGRDQYNNATQNFICQLNACLAPSLKFDFKLDDFTMLDVDFSAFIDLYGNLATFYILNP